MPALTTRVIENDEQLAKAIDAAIRRDQDAAELALEVTVAQSRLRALMGRDAWIVAARIEELMTQRWCEMSLALVRFGFWRARSEGDGDDRGIRCRGEAQSLLRSIHDSDTAIAVAVERGVLKAVEGNCRMPLAANATRDKQGRLLLRAMLANPDGSNLRVCEEHTLWPSGEGEAEAFGREIGLRLRG